MKARPNSPLDDYVLVINKLNRSQVSKVFMPTYTWDEQHSYSELANHSCGDDCNVPQFVYQMNGSLFAQIDGVADFNFMSESGGKSGYLMLLNIEGRPKFCFTFEGDDITRQVRHKVLLLC